MPREGPVRYTCSTAYDAKLDSKPLVGIVGQQMSTILGSAYQQEIDLVRVFGDVCGQLAQVAYTPERVAHAAREIWSAVAGPAPEK